MKVWNRNYSYTLVKYRQARRYLRRKEVLHWSQSNKRRSCWEGIKVIRWNNIHSFFLSSWTQQIATYSSPKHVCSLVLLLSAQSKLSISAESSQLKSGWQSSFVTYSSSVCISWSAMTISSWKYEIKFKAPIPKLQIITKSKRVRWGIFHFKLLLQ